MKLWKRIPANVQSVIRHVALAFLAGFIAVAAPLLPALEKQLGTGQVDLSTVKALIAAAIAGGVAGAIRYATLKLTPPA